MFIVAFNAETTICDVLSRLPVRLGDVYDVEVLIIDDGSSDRTFEHGTRMASNGGVPFAVTVLFNRVNPGYGGNQKIGYHYAIEHGFDIVVLLHGDGQYAPECMPDLLEPIRTGGADACFGSRVMEKVPRVADGCRSTSLSATRSSAGSRTGCCGWSFRSSTPATAPTPRKRRTPFAENTNDFHFDTEIIIQFKLAGLQIAERPIPTYYGDEICHVNGLKYAWDVVRSVLKMRM